ncbi:MAG: ABC transporter substrate-binding protein [Syntrophaceae bacterium]
MMHTTAIRIGGLNPRALIFALLFWLCAAPMSAATAAAPVVLKDAAGRTLSLPASPQRIVIVGRGPFMPLHLLYMFATGGERLVGVEERSQTLSFARSIDPQFSSKMVLKPNPGPEQIAALKPDVVIIKGTSEDQTCLALKRINIPVMYVGLENPEQFFQDVRAVGTLLGEPARAEEIVRFYRTRLDTVRTRLKGIPEQSKPRVLVFAYHNRSGKAAVEVPAASWMQTIQARESGGRPVWTEALKETDGWSVVNFEQIASWNPDCIHITIWHTLDPAEVIKGLSADPQWRKLKAVKSGRIHAIPSDLFGWDTPEPRWILGLTWMAAKTWPERFKDYSLEGSVRAFFRELYRLDDKTIETRILPHLRPKS